MERHHENIEIPHNFVSSLNLIHFCSLCEMLLTSFCLANKTKKDYNCFIQMEACYE